MSTSPAAEAARRRTFAIISHPDAGKTTLTENLLLAGGAIRAAGAVRARGENRRTRSDWMKIERERGISVSASVMTFDHAGLMFNLLDTPGHEDFSEDTYRTLTAADAAVMVLDAAKGIEPQTLKLFEVCRLRDIPILTFINKMDREAQDPFALLDEIASKLALDPAPLYWPAGSGGRFKGMIDLRREQFIPFRKKGSGPDAAEGHPEPVSLTGNSTAAYLDAEEQAEVEEGASLVQEAAKPFDVQSFLEGHMTPVFFGSALRHFGVDQLLEGLGAYAPPPKPVAASKNGEPIHVAPGEKEVSGFVFKIQANMDPNHRDRIAFLRLTSGRFSRGMKLKVQNTGRQLSVNAPVMFFASDRELAEEAYAGDVIGIPNHGVLRVGDSLSETGTLRFAGLPNFAPEILQRVRVKDPLKAKHL
ncbi:MAG: peptide chain release factor 3, partial [Phenylobacterium sp.]|nr:peptide chain release factor 3 [Phenylobacterium sp.]